MPDDIRSWFLTTTERGNPDTTIDEARGEEAWTAGNDVVALVHGATYFACLHDVLGRTGDGDLVLFTDWRGDGDERLTGEPGSELAAVLVDAPARGAEVRGLVWRSHPDEARLSEQEAIHLAEAVNEAGGEVLLDERVRRAGSHHQKLVLVRHPGREAGDVAFVGGIDLCHGRRDDERHRGDAQAAAHGPPLRRHAAVARRPGAGPGPGRRRPGPHVPGALGRPDAARPPQPVAPLDRPRSPGEPRRPEPLPPRPAIPPEAGRHAVQILRTYPAKRPPYPFAPQGERSIARAYAKAFARARRLISIEDQYLWSAEVGRVMADALRQSPDLLLVALVPRFPEASGRLSEPPELVGHQQAVEQVRAAGGDRVAIYDLENDDGTPVYVHAKACIVDDVWATVGSDNLNLRSWTHDSELACAVLDATRDEREPRDPGGRGDGARRFARDLRLRLAAEHLGRPPDDPELLDPVDAFRVWRETAVGPGSLVRRAGASGPARPAGCGSTTRRPCPGGRCTRAWPTGPSSTPTAGPGVSARPATSDHMPS